MHKKEFNPDGTLRNEARIEMLSSGMIPEAIDDYARRLKIKYDEWKHLDETDPEPWPVYTAYDFFTSQLNAECSLTTSAHIYLQLVFPCLLAEKADCLVNWLAVL